MAPKKRKNPFDTVQKEETTDADKPLYEAVFNVGKRMKTQTTASADDVMTDIATAEDIQTIIDDFEHGKTINKVKLENIVKLTMSYKELQQVEDKIKTSKEKLIALVAGGMWRAGEHDGNFSKEHFIRYLLKEKEKKEKDTVMT